MAERGAMSEKCGRLTAAGRVCDRIGSIAAAPAAQTRMGSGPYGSLEFMGFRTNRAIPYMSVYNARSRRFEMP